MANAAGAASSAARQAARGKKSAVGFKLCDYFSKQDDEDPLQAERGGEDAVMGAQVATADNLPIENDDGVTWQADANCETAVPPPAAAAATLQRRSSTRAGRGTNAWRQVVDGDSD